MDNWLDSVYFTIKNNFQIAKIPKGTEFLETDNGYLQSWQSVSIEARPQANREYKTRVANQKLYLFVLSDRNVKSVCYNEKWIKADPVNLFPIFLKKNNVFGYCTLFNGKSERIYLFDKSVISDFDYTAKIDSDNRLITFSRGSGSYDKVFPRNIYRIGNEKPPEAYFNTCIEPLYDEEDIIFLSDKAVLYSLAKQIQSIINSSRVGKQVYLDGTIMNIKEDEIVLVLPLNKTISLILLTILSQTYNVRVPNKSVGKRASNYGAYRSGLIFVLKEESLKQSSNDILKIILENISLLEGSEYIGGKLTVNDTIKKLLNEGKLTEYHIHRDLYVKKDYSEYSHLIYSQTKIKELIPQRDIFFSRLYLMEKRKPYKLGKYTKEGIRRKENYIEINGLKQIISFSYPLNDKILKSFISIFDVDAKECFTPVPIDAEQLVDYDNRIYESDGSDIFLYISEKPLYIHNFITDFNVVRYSGVTFDEEKYRIYRNIISKKVSVIEKYRKYLK